MGILDILDGSRTVAVPHNQHSATGSQVDNILSSDLAIHNEFYNKNIIISDEFGVFVLVNLQKGFNFDDFQMQFRICIDAIYKNGIYFSELDRKLLETLLYGNQDEVSSITHPEFNGVRICSQVKQLSDKERRYFDILYGGNVQSEKDPMTGIFVPNLMTYIEKMLGEEYRSHEMFILRGDLFHAYLWGQGIKYFGESSFLENIDKSSRDTLDDILKSSDHIVAKGKKPKDTIDDKRRDYETVEKEKDIFGTGDFISNEFPSLKIRKRPILVQGKTLGGGEVECIFPKVKQKQCVLEIIFGKSGELGVTISGKMILSQEIKKMTVSSQLYQGYEEFIDIDETYDDKIRIIAKEDFYLVVDKQNKVGFSKHKKFIGNIGKNTGSISLPKDGTIFELQGDIQEGYYIDGHDVIYSGQIFGQIYAQNDITIKSGGILGGKIHSSNGNISTEKSVRIQDKTEIEALNGNISIQGDPIKATIKASTITVFGTATNCTCIGGHVKIHENNGSKVMAEVFDIDRDRNGNSEYTIFVYSGICGMMNILHSKIQAKEGEYTKAQKILEKMTGDQVLVSGNIHTESRFQLMVTTFIFNDFLYNFAYPHLQREFISTKRGKAISEVIASDKKNEGVICSLENHSVTRDFALSNLTEKLENKSESRVAQRDPLFSRGLRLSASVNHLKGHIFDYSDSGCSFIFRDDLKQNENIVISSTIDVTILDGQSIPFFITRIEKRVINGVPFIFVAGKYIGHGIGKEISKIVAIKDTEKRK